MGRLRTLPDYKCPNCEVVFRPENSIQKFCSRKCSLKMRPKKGFDKKCLYCGIRFYVIPFHKNQQCCKQAHTILLQKKKAFRFKCIICNKEVQTQPTQITYRNRKTCSKTCSAANKRSIATERRIKNGYTQHQLDRLARYSPEAKEWREQVFKRDNWTCQMCSKRGGIRLEADHIKPFAYFHELRFELSNGRTLCRPCHDTTKIGARKMRELYGTKSEN